MMGAVIRYHAPGHERLHADLRAGKSLAEIARDAKIRYSRMIRIIGGSEPRAQEVMLLAAYGIPPEAWLPSRSDVLATRSR